MLRKRLTILRSKQGFKSNTYSVYTKYVHKIALSIMMMRA